MMNSCVRTIYRIEAEEDGPARARAIVDEELSAVVSRRKLKELQLMVSELVTNGIKFGTKDRNESLTLDLRVDDHVRCSVITRGGLLRGDENADPKRWGLKVISALAERSGVKRLGERTHIWFETTPAIG